MRIVSKIALSMFALTLLLAFAPKAFAADAAGGSIAGTVTGSDGKMLANAPVRLMAPPPAKPAAAAPKSALNLADKPADAPKKPGKGPAAIKETTTNDKGEFTFADVVPGDYVVAAGNKELGMGREKVTVKASEKATVAITLKAPKAK